jgi:hypothetical protein
MLELLLKPSSSTQDSGNILGGKLTSSNNNNGHTSDCAENQTPWQWPFFEQRVYTSSFAPCWVCFRVAKNKNQFLDEGDVKTNSWDNITYGASNEIVLLSCALSLPINKLQAK